MKILKLNELTVVMKFDVNFTSSHSRDWDCEVKQVVRPMCIILIF